MEITAEMHRAGLAAFEEWRAAPLGVGHGDVVSRVLTAALDAAPTQLALPAPAQEPTAQPIEPEPVREIEGALELVAHDGDASEETGAEREPAASLE